ncbi:sigma-70 family RNA polymerase sigma factor [Spirosoma luteolum]
MPHSPAFSDHDTAEQRWQRFREGCTVSFGQLADAHYRLLYNYGRRFSDDAEFVRDCIQLLLLDLWNRRETLSDPPVVKAYLLKAFRHRLLKETERHRRRQSAEEWAFDLYAVDNPVEQQIVETEWQQEQLQRLNDRIGRLTRREQEIIYLRFYQQLDYEAIAGIMELTRPSVANLLSKSLRRLKENWFDPILPLLMLLGGWS